MMCGCCGVKAAGLDGKYLSQSGELMFVFKGDSLYVDIAQSMRNLSAFRLCKENTCPHRGGKDVSAGVLW